MPDRLILLFGLPRSGTTWAGKILDSHPATLYRHEPDSVNRLMGVSLVPEASDPASLELIRSYARSVVTNRHPKVVGKAPIFAKSYLNPTALYLYKAGTKISKILASVGIELSVATAPAHCDPEGAIVWKSIESLGRLGLLIEALSDVIGLHMVRHPCGFVASVQRGERSRRFQDNRGASEDYGILELLLGTSTAQRYGLDLTDLKAMQPEERLAWRWCIFNDKVLDDVSTNTRVLSFAYEDLCDSPILTAKALMRFAGLSWDQQIERFLSASTAAHDKTYYSVFKDPRKAAYGWQTELTSDEVARVLAIARRSRTWGLLYGQNEKLPQSVSH